MNKCEIDICIPEEFIKFFAIDYPNKKTVTICRYNQLKELISKAFIESRLKAKVIFTTNKVDKNFFSEINGEIQVKQINEDEYKSLYEFYKDSVVKYIIEENNLSTDEKYFILQTLYDTKIGWIKLNKLDRTPDM